MMSRRPLAPLAGAPALLSLIACGFSASGAGVAGADAAGDAPRADARAADAAPDAPPDAPPAPVTTEHPSVADTFLASDMPSVNYSTQVSALADGDTRRVALFRFDLSAISPTALVSGAALELWTDFDPGAPVTLYAVLQSWDEATATWSQRMTGVAWATAGAAPPSRGVTAIGAAAPSTPDAPNQITLDTATVAGWVASPSTNLGLVIVTDAEDGARFSTREKADGARRPVLRVTHAP